MKHTLLILPILLLSLSCAQENIVVETPDPLAFSVEVTTVNGLISLNNFETAPCVKVTVVSGEDVDYEIACSVDNGPYDRTENTVWLGKTRSVYFDLTPEISSHVIKGKVFRSDDKAGERVYEFEKTISIYSETPESIYDISFESSRFEGLRTEATRARIGAPAMDEGILSFSVYPKESVASDFSFSGVLDCDISRMTRSAEGIVTVPYVSTAEGNAYVVYDNGSAKDSTRFEVAWYPTVILQSDTTVAQMTHSYYVTSSPHAFHHSFNSELSFYYKTVWSNVDSIYVNFVSFSGNSSGSTVSLDGERSGQRTVHTEMDSLLLAGTWNNEVEKITPSMIIGGSLPKNWCTMTYLSPRFKVSSKIPCFWTVSQVNGNIAAGECYIPEASTVTGYYTWQDIPVKGTHYIDPESDLFALFNDGQNISDYLK